ncbi:MAG: general secretion pathway protein GspB [Nitrospirae bacterium]|nr:general secretion pathway protein GspB [Nitrospirota bacterium]
MSFILDALKKLEHKRHRSSLPGLLTVHDFTSEKPAKRFPSAYFFAAVLLVNAAVMLVWLYPWSDNQHAVKQAADAQSYEEPLVRTGGEIFEKQTPALPQRDAGIKSALTPPPAARPADVIPPVKPVAVEAKKVPDALLRPPAEPKASPVLAPGEKIHDKDELPDSVRQGLPDIAISGHIYSNNPLSRIVNINGKILREGESIAGGLRLEDITEYGVVLNYQGYRFRMRGY